MSDHSQRPSWDRVSTINPPQSNQVADLLRQHVPVEGPVDTPVDGVKLYRADQKMPRTPVLYEPWLLFVVQGEKRGYLGNYSFDYGGLCHLAFTVPMPMEAEILQASPERPFLALGICIEPAEIGEIFLQSDLGTEDLPNGDCPVQILPVSDSLQNALIRLLQTFDVPSDAAVLGPLIRREILYRVMAGAQGGALLAAIQRQGHLRHIGDLVRRIHDDCAAPLTITEMSRLSGLSRTALHESFKAVTSLTPLQYLKSLRLHKARTLILNEGMSARTAGFQVGYSSASQFSREFKRFFGEVPSQVGRLDG